MARPTLSMPKPKTASSLSANLDDLLEHSRGGSISLGSVFDGVGEKGFGLLLSLLSLPSALPVPAAGYSTPFGILVAILSLQMILIRPAPKLPSFAEKYQLNHQTAAKLFHAAKQFLSLFERFIHPRMKWVSSPAGRMALGWLTLAMSCLMILPIPLTNTLPAIVIFAVGLGLSEDDGIVCLLALAFGLVAVGFYLFIIYLLLTVGMEGVDVLKQAIKSWFKMS